MNNNLELFTSPRQFPVDANVIHTFGQLMATTGPALFIIQSLGILSVLIGVLTVALVEFSIAPESVSANNFGFAFVSGGVFSAITSQYESSQAAAANRVGNSDGSGAVVTSSSSLSSSANKALSNSGVSAYVFFKKSAA